MDMVAVVGDWSAPLVHVLHQRSAERHVDDLRASADRAYGQPDPQGPAGDREVEGVLLNVDVVEGLMVRLPRPVRGEVAAAGQQDPFGPGGAGH